MSPFRLTVQSRTHQGRSHEHLLCRAPRQVQVRMPCRRQRRRGRQRTRRRCLHPLPPLRPHCRRPLRLRRPDRGQLRQHGRRLALRPRHARRRPMLTSRTRIRRHPIRPGRHRGGLPGRGKGDGSRFHWSVERGRQCLHNYSRLLVFCPFSVFSRLGPSAQIQGLDRLSIADVEPGADQGGDGPGRLGQDGGLGEHFHVLGRCAYLAEDAVLVEHQEAVAGVE